MDYNEILHNNRHQTQEMVAAFKRSDFVTGHRAADEIAELYFPDDDMMASKVGYLLKTVGAEMFFGGIDAQLSRQFDKR